MNIILDYECTRSLVLGTNWDMFLNYLNKLCKDKGRNLRLYGVSQDWLENRKYICKAKGENGDLIISWI